MFLDKVDLLVLEELGKDSRVHLKTIAEKAGVSIQTVSSRLGHIEEKLGLRYSLEFDLDAAGMRSEHFIRVKFRDGAAPDAETLKAALASPYVQLACKTKGDFDLFIWAVTPTPQKFSSDVEPSIREALDEYVEDWTSHPLISRRTGFLPVSRELVEQFIAPNSRRKVLGILNENSRMMVMELAEQLGVSEPTAEYHLKKVRPFVKRFTVFFEGKGDFAHVIRFFQVRGKKKDLETDGRKVTAAYLNSDPRLFNRLVYAATPSGGMDCFLIETYSSLDDNSTATEQLLSEKRIVGKHASATVTKVLKGAIPIRKVNLTDGCKYLLSPAEIPGD